MCLLYVMFMFIALRLPADRQKLVYDWEILADAIIIKAPSGEVCCIKVQDYL